VPLADACYEDRKSLCGNVPPVGGAPRQDLTRLPLLLLDKALLLLQSTRHRLPAALRRAAPPHRHGHHHLVALVQPQPIAAPAPSRLRRARLA
jgi:hypothetical protein